MTLWRSADAAAALALTVFIVLVVAAFLLRIALRGRVQYDRVDRQGSSALLGKGSMEMGYWMLQGMGRGLARRGVSPNQISWLSLVCGVGAGVVLAAGLFGAGAILGMLSGFFDVLDGMVARATGVSSDAGEVLDAAIDRYTEYFFFGGLAIHYHAFPWLMAVTLMALTGSSMVTYSTAKAEAFGTSLRSAFMRRHERSTLVCVGAWLSGLSVPFLEPRLNVTPGIGVPMVLMLVVVAVLANVAAIRRLHQLAGRLATGTPPPAG